MTEISHGGFRPRTIILRQKDLTVRLSRVKISQRVINFSQRVLSDKCSASLPINVMRRSFGILPPEVKQARSLVLRGEGHRRAGTGKRI